MYQSGPDRQRTGEDAVRRHVWGEVKYKATGTFLTVRGNGTKYTEAPVIHVGYGFNLPKNSNAEVFTFSDSRDPTQKFALPTLPRDKQRQWPENSGGIQSPVDPSRAVEINEKRTQVHDKSFAIGEKGGFESNGDTSIFRGNVIIEGDLQVKGSLIVGGQVVANGSIINGVLNAGLVKTNNVVPGPENKPIDIIIPPFEK